MAINSRSNETQADEFSFRTGYGREQISALYLLQKININADLSFSQKLKASHPNLAEWIEHLEKLENGELIADDLFL